MTDPNEEITELSNSEKGLNLSPQEDDTPQQNNEANKPTGDTERKGPVNYKEERGKRGRHGQNRSNKGFQLNSAGLIRHFLGCRVCCYFLSGIQVLYGREIVERLVTEFDGKWMTVPLTSETRELISKTYGLRLDLNDTYIDYGCEVCCRRFNFDLPEGDPERLNDSAEVNQNGSENVNPIPEEAMPQPRSLAERLADWEDESVDRVRFEFKHRR